MDPKAQKPEVMDTLNEIHETQTRMLAALENLTDRLNPSLSLPASQSTSEPTSEREERSSGNEQPEDSQLSSAAAILRGEEGSLQAPAPASPTQRSALTSRIVLTYALDPWFGLAVHLLILGPIRNKSA